MKKIKYLFIFIIHILFYFVSAFFVKSKKIWVFGSWSGKQYADNSKYLFEWVNENHKEIKCYWVSDKQEIITLVKKKGLRAVKAGSIKWFFIVCSASLCFETEGNKDIGGYKPARCKIIQLWHGSGPKKMRWNRNYSKIEKIILKYISDDYENMYWFVSSLMNGKYLQDYFHFDNSHLFVTGYSRIDSLLEAPKVEAELLFGKDRVNHRKIIYMPTHRFFGKEPATIPSIEQLKKLDKELSGKNIVFVFKPHFHELKKYVDNKTEFENIILADSILFQDVYSYIRHFDVLVSDYSSIIYDFLVLNRPIILYDYDFDKYNNSEGLLDCYEKYICGPIVKTWEETTRLILNYENDDFWEEKRLLSRDAFHTFYDGKNCERAFETAINMLYGKRK